MNAFDPNRLMRLNRQRLVQIRDRAQQLQREAGDPRVERLALEIAEVVNPVIGRSDQVPLAEKVPSAVDLAAMLSVTETARAAALRIGSPIPASGEEEPSSETDRVHIGRVQEIHRDLKACLASIEGDLKRRLAPADAL